MYTDHARIMFAQTMEYASEGAGLHSLNPSVCKLVVLALYFRTDIVKQHIMQADFGISSSLDKFSEVAARQEAS